MILSDIPSLLRYLVLDVCICVRLHIYLWLPVKYLSKLTFFSRIFWIYVFSVQTNSAKLFSHIDNTNKYKTQVFNAGSWLHSRLNAFVKSKFPRNSTCFANLTPLKKFLRSQGSFSSHPAIPSRFLNWCPLKSSRVKLEKKRQMFQ